MNAQDLGRAIAWGWHNGGLVMRVLGNPDFRALLDALKELGDSGPSDSGATLHEVLVKRGVDTEQLAREIHPIGPQPEGNGNPQI